MKNKKILMIDIETSPSLGYVWGKWEQNVIDFKDHWRILAFSAKWLGEKNVMAYTLPDFKSYTKNSEDDIAIMNKIWDLLDEAEVVVAHNGVEFDIKKINARFAYHKLPPPSPYKVVDTLKEAKKYFAFDSNKLDDLGTYLQLGNKLQHTGWKMWIGCMNGDRKSWKLMKKYNIQDVVLLEKVYLRLLPYMKTHPNLGMFTDSGECCPKCSSTNLQSRGYMVTLSGRFRRFQCQDCGGWGRPRVKETKTNVSIVSA